MPEGDTIFRTARTLDRALSGRTVMRFGSVLPALERVDYDSPLAGRTVESVVSRGKWVLMRFSGDLTLLTHMRMSGSWHIYRPGEKWQLPRGRMRVTVETAEIIAVAFDVTVAEFHTAASLARREGFAELGPDLLTSDFDAATAVANLAARGDWELGVALLDQSALAGIGNVFKSEVAFACGVNPFRKVSTLTREHLAELVHVARRYLKANVTEDSGHLRRTVGSLEGEERLWVYGRAGKACRRCAAEIRSAKHADGRVSFWCPVCQEAGLEANGVPTAH
jgi:endonuclease-8